MSHNYYSEINLHMVWHSKLSRPLLTSVHLAVSIAPTVQISELVGLLKGYSAHEVNRRAGLKQKVLQWQSGYGGVGFGTKDLPWVVNYLRRQKEHHAHGTVHERLERISRFDEAPEAEADEEGP